MRCTRSVCLACIAAALQCLTYMGVNSPTQQPHTLEPCRLGASWPEAQWAQVWHDLLEARQSGLSSQLPASELAAAFLRVLLLAQQYHLAVQLLPMYSQQQQQQYYAAPGGGGGTPTAGTPIALAGLEGGVPGGAFDLAMDAALAQQQQQQHGERPSTAEAALAALTGGAGAGGGGAGHAFTGSSRFGVRRALHNAAGAAVSTAVGRTAKLMGVSAHLVGSTAHLVGSTAQAVQYGAGGMVGATAGLVSGTASLVSSAATFAAEAAAKAGSRTGVGGKGSSVGGSAFLQGAGGLLTMQEAEGVVVQVSQELLASAASLEDPAVAAAEAVLQLLPPECKVGGWVLGWVNDGLCVVLAVGVGGPAASMSSRSRHLHSAPLCT